MKHIFKSSSILAVFALLFVFGVSSTTAQKRPVLKKKTTAKKVIRPATPVFTVSSGTVMRVRMNRTISSKTAKIGDTFTTTVTEPVYSSNGVVVIPTGSTLTGRVTAVKPAAKGGKPGEIDASFVSLRLPNGRTRAINGSLTELESGKTTSDDEGTASAKKTKYRKVIFIGGGAAGGALLGSIVGGGKATAIGAILGAGAGFLGDRMTKGSEAEVKSGTEFGVYLNQSFSLPRFVETANP